MNTRSRPLVVLLLGLGALACGYKAPPQPPPLKNPATTTDLGVQQRGDELILEFTYPLTTLGGLPLERIEKVEYWEVTKPLNPPVEDETEGDEEAEEEGAEEGEETEEATEADPEESEEAAEEEETPSFLQEEVVPRGAEERTFISA